MACYNFYRSSCFTSRSKINSNTLRKMLSLLLFYVFFQFIYPNMVFVVFQGKKSISNLLQEAVDYIINTKKNIEKLRLQRELKKLSNSNNLSADVGRSSSYLPNCLVTVNPFLDDVEILISSNFKGEEFPLSKVLKELLGRGFNVVNCVTTKANERSLHRIHCEVQFVGVIDVLQGLGLLLLCTLFTFYYSSFFQASNFKCNDLSGLQERLGDVINHGCETSTQRSSDKWVCVSS